MVTEAPGDGRSRVGAGSGHTGTGVREPSPTTTPRSLSLARTHQTPRKEKAHRQQQEASVWYGAQSLTLHGWNCTQDGRLCSSRPHSSETSPRATGMDFHKELISHGKVSAIETTHFGGLRKTEWEKETERGFSLGGRRGPTEVLHLSWGTGTLMGPRATPLCRTARVSSRMPRNHFEKHSPFFSRETPAQPPPSDAFQAPGSLCGCPTRARAEAALLVRRCDTEDGRLPRPTTP